MTKQTVTMPGYMGKPWEVTGEIKDGLILHKMGQSWCITHVATGCGVGRQGLRLKRDAIARRDALLALGVNWGAASLEEIAASGGMDARQLYDKLKPIAY